MGLFMKRILIVNSFYYPDIKGGAEVSTQLLAEGLTEDYEVYALATGEHKKGIIRETINGVNVYRIPSNNLYWPGRASKRGNLSKLLWHFINNYNPIQNRIIEKVIDEISPSLIHTQNLMGIGTHLWNIANRLSIPLVHTTRDYALMEPVSNNLINKYFNYYNRKRSQKINYVVGISEFILKQHIEKGFFNGIPSSSIHNIVNNQAYTRRYRKEGEPLILGYYGQLEENKGIEVLIDSLKDIPASIVEKVWICGVGSLEEKLVNITKDDKRIIFKGKLPIEEVYKTMAMTDLTIVPSIWEEPFGRVIIESYNQGTPVIGSNTGGIPEIIPNKDYLFQRKDFEELREKIIKFYKLDEKQLNKEIEESYKQAEKYTENVSKYINVYKAISASV